jgi:hypothetical protein
MTPAGHTGLTSTGYRLVLLITALSIAHHVDHMMRDVTGWPFRDEFNPFSASLFVYPVIAAGLVLSRRNRVGARFWAVLAGAAALFILAVHVGPAAGDSVTTIPTRTGDGGRRHRTCRARPVPRCAPGAFSPRGPTAAVRAGVTLTRRRPGPRRSLDAG